MPPLNHFQKSCLSLAIGNALIFSSVSQAVTITVNTTADGIQGNTANCSLREAITLLNLDRFSNNLFGCALLGGAGDEINFDLPTGSTITLTHGEMKISDTLSISGPGQDSLTIDAQHNSRIFNVDGFDTIFTSISGLTLANGYANDGLGGGAIRVNQSAFFSLSDSTIRDSAIGPNIIGEISDGGGISLNDSNGSSISNTIVSGNESRGTSAAGSGGGISIKNSLSISINDSTVFANSTDKAGGGIYLNGTGSVAISNSTIRENTAFIGGGIDIIDSGSASIIDSTITDNVSNSTGGGITVRASNSVSITNSSIVANRATGGIVLNQSDIGPTIIGSGGISLERINTTTIANTTISENTANNDGGGIGLFFSDSTSITNSTISTNMSATNGGGIAVFGNYVALIHNSTLSGNLADNFGGGLLNIGYGSTIDLFSNTIIDNVSGSTNGGDGIYTTTSASVILGTLNVVANNSDSDCNRIIIDSGENWIGDNSCRTTANPNLSGDPKLGPLQDNGGLTLTHAPLPGSGLIKAASLTCTNSSIGGVDQRGKPRGTSKCTIGAVEHIPKVVVIPLDDDFFVIPTQ